MTFLKKSFAIAMCTAMALGAWAGGNRIPSLANMRINGVMMYDKDKSTTNTGVYSYTVTDPVQRKAVAPIERINISGDAVMIDGKIYTYLCSVSYGYVNSAKYYVYDAATGAVISSTSMGYDLATAYSHAASSSAVDPTTGTVYVSGYEYNADTQSLQPYLKTWDVAANTKAPVAALPGTFIAMAFDAEGQLYAITGSPSEVPAGAGRLMKVDKTSGECTLVGDTGVTPKFDQSAVIDHNTGIFYWFANDAQENAVLYTVDLTTGAATKVSDLPNGDEVVAAWIPAQTTPDAAPSAASELAVAFEGRELSGKVSFTLPGLDFSGNALDAELTWAVSENGETLATGTAAAGADVTADVTVAAAGVHTFTVTVSNEAGTSPAEEISLYIGPDVPAAATAVTLVREDSKSILTWTAPARGLNDRYMNPDELTYTIVRMPAGVTVAENHVGTTFEEEYEPEGIESISYKVTPVNYGIAGAAATSNTVKAGSALVPPFEAALTSAADLDIFTIIDANADKKTWAYYSNTVRYTANFNAAADDWLILPPLKLEAGKSYTLGFTAYGGNARNTNKLDVHMGSAADAAAMGDALQSYSYSNVAASASNETIVLYPAETGTYFIGFHLNSASSQSYFYLKNIAVSAGASTKVPAKIQNLSVTPGAEGALSAGIAFTAPTTDALGNELDELTSVIISRDGTEIVTLTESVAPGAELSYTDTEVPDHGTHTYAVQAINSYGASEIATTSAYIGYDTPCAPASVVLKDNFDGTATVEWEAPEAVGANGGYVHHPALRYTLHDHKANVLAEDVEGLTSVIPFDNEAETQTEMHVKIYARHADASVASAAAQSNTVLAGKPYATPFAESFADATYSTSPWTKNVIEGKSYDSSWSLRADADYDGDGAGLDLNAQAAGAVSRMEGPKVDISSASKPQLSMWVKIPYDGLTFSLQLKKGNDDWTTVHTLADETDWTNVSVPLADYKTSALRVGLHAAAAKTGYVYVDKIGINDIDYVGLDAAEIAAGARVAVLDGAIRVAADVDADIAVYTAAGVCIFSTHATTAKIPAAKGVYIVTIGSATHKVIVK